MDQQQITRRMFVRDAAAAGLALAVPAVHGAEKDKKYRTAVIGSGWWGIVNLKAALEAGRCDPIALCDVDETSLDTAATDLAKVTSQIPKRYKDYRELLDKEKPEVVIVATPDHWHALPTIAAVKAGAHVLVEKPICHTINEGRAMLKAARDCNRVVQVGTHRRCGQHYIAAMKFLKEGQAGKIGMIRAFCGFGGPWHQNPPDVEPPKGLDWDFWCGPAPYRPFNKQIHPRGFRSFLDFATGAIGDWGHHFFDLILWLSEQKYPTKVYSTGGKFIVNDRSDAPDTQIATYDFDAFRVVWEHRSYAANMSEKHGFGIYFYGTEGIVYLGIDGWTYYPQKKGAPIIHEDSEGRDAIRELWNDLLDCIETGNAPFPTSRTARKRRTCRFWASSR